MQGKTGRPPAPAVTPAPPYAQKRREGVAWGRKDGASLYTTGREACARQCVRGGEEQPWLRHRMHKGGGGWCREGMVEGGKPCRPSSFARVMHACNKGLQGPTQEASCPGSLGVKKPQLACYLASARGVAAPKSDGLQGFFMSRQPHMHWGHVQGHAQPQTGPLPHHPRAHTERQPICTEVVCVPPTCAMWGWNSSHQACSHASRGWSRVRRAMPYSTCSNRECMLSGPAATQKVRVRRAVPYSTCSN